MTEEEWMGCADPQAMLEYIRVKVSDRKLRLFACACSRNVWLHLSISTKEAVQVAERFADGDAIFRDFRNKVYTLAAQSSEKEQNVLFALGYYHGNYWRPDHVTAIQGLAIDCATRKAIQTANPTSRQLLYLYDIFGNPYRPITINPNWLTPTVTNLATIAYEERTLPSGELDTARLAIVADALEDAGCDNQEILGHLRSPGPHVRGCHVLDLILGKE